MSDREKREGPKIVNHCATALTSHGRAEGNGVKESGDEVRSQVGRGRTPLWFFVSRSVTRCRAESDILHSLLKRVFQILLQNALQWRACAHTHTHARTHMRTHAHARAHALLSVGLQQVSREPGEDQA